MAPALHPRNTSFQWTPPQRPLTTISDADADQFDRDGYFVVPNAFTGDELAPVVAELDRIETKAEAMLRQLPDGRFSIAEADAITFVPQLAHSKHVLRAFTTHPVLLGLARDLVGPDVDMYWDQAVYKKPQKPRRFPWHQDNGYTFVDPQQYLTCWVALTDATEENGCPHVAVGQHVRGTLAHTYVEPLGWQIFEDAGETAVAEVGAGGVVVFSSLTPHLTGPNVTDTVRKAYILQYSPAGARVLEGHSSDGPVDVGSQPHAYAVLRDGVAVSGNTV
jgi:phytanoyl-CoA hydroxylase